MFSIKIRLLIAASMALVLGHFFLESRASAAGPVEEKRIAIVIGNGAYPSDPVATAANDAGLIAQTLQAAALTLWARGILIARPCGRPCGSLSTRRRLRARRRSL